MRSIVFLYFLCLLGLEALYAREIDFALKNEAGEYIVVFKREFDEIFEKIFFGNLAELRQQEATHTLGAGDQFKSFHPDHRNESKQYHLYSNLNEKGFTSRGEFFIQCDKAKIKYKKVEGNELADLQKMIDSGSPQLTYLPRKAHGPRFLFKRKNGEYIYVSKPKYYDIEEFKVYAGRPGEMKEVEVSEVESDRDGTVKITTKEGNVLYSPSSKRRKERATYMGEELEYEKIHLPHYDLSFLQIEGVPFKPQKTSTPCDRFYRKRRKQSRDLKENQR